jgi:hypothetical protein
VINTHGGMGCRGSGVGCRVSARKISQHAAPPS